MLAAAHDRPQYHTFSPNVFGSASITAQPMPPLTETTIRSLTAYTEAIEAILAATGRIQWFRGNGKESYKLLPSLYRHPTIADLEELMNLERRLMLRFQQRSIPFLIRPYGDDWGCLFLMQHSGVPTRLLDWTENPYVALYFALSSAPFTLAATGQVYHEAAAVWVLDPAEWNRQALQHMGYRGGVLSPGDEQLRGYQPAIQTPLMNAEPVALYGSHNSARIVAQRGVFLILGRNLQAVEDAYESGNYPADCLRKLVIPADAIAQMLNALVSVGITDSAVYPDLDGLAKELKRQFGYPVYV